MEILSDSEEDTEAKNESEREEEEGESIFEYLDRSIYV